MRTKSGQEFHRDESGALAVVFAFVLGIVVIGAGLAIDYGRSQSVKSHLQAAVDASVLAAARSLLTTETELEAIAHAVFESNKPSSDSITIGVRSFALNGNAVTYSATAAVPTTFMGITGTTELSVNASAGAYRRTDGTEIVIALDTTGSMGFGSSWSDAKSAMADLLVELDAMAETQTEFYATFFPFADRVNVGLARAQNWISVPNPTEGHWGNKPNGTGSTNKGCLEPRDELINGNANALSDKSPSTLGFLPSAENYWISNLAEQSYFTCPQHEIMGPTNNIASFQSTIAQLPLNGTGRYDVGLAWAYRLLSPKWQGHWGVAGYPAAYGSRRKIAVFVTDAYTEAFRYEVPNQTGSGTNAVLGWNQGSTLGFENMVEVCNRMKADGIEIHTIYVNGNSHGIPYMQQCATNVSSHYHNVTDIGELRDALRRIAVSVVAVGLTN